MVFLFLGLHTLPVDDLMQSKVQEYDCCFICTICGKSISLNNMGKHMRNIHPSCDGAYYCPPTCDKYFKISRYCISKKESMSTSATGIMIERVRTTTILLQDLRYNGSVRRICFTKVISNEQLCIFLSNFNFFSHGFIHFRR